MKRLIEQDLIKWSKNKNSLPLFVIGSRQIGKTYSVLQFAKNHYKNKYVYFNFLEHDENYKMFQKTNSPKEIIELIKFITNKEIDESWLIIFDEIQEMNNVKSSLKHFVEQNYKHKIICLGSYLGNMLNDKTSFPVGKIEILKMYPLNFEEFLIAKDKAILIDKIKNCLINKTTMDNIYHLALIELLKEYIVVGGMPKVLDTYLKNNSLTEANKIKSTLIETYQRDIIKYVEKNNDKLKCQTIYENIPLFLAKQNNKYKLSKIDNTARYLNYESAIKSLLTTKIIYKINNLKTFSSPIKMHKNESEFKIYYNDPGFISNIFNLTMDILMNNNEYGNLKGSLFENYVLSELVQKIDIDNISYYSFRDKSNNHYEIDFCIEDNLGKLIPIEVKSNDKFNTKSLNKLAEERVFSYSLIFSFKNFGFESNKIKIPLYAIPFLEYSNNRINLKK